MQDVFRIYSEGDVLGRISDHKLDGAIRRVMVQARI